MTPNRRMFLLALTSWVTIPIVRAHADDDDRRHKGKGRRKRRRTRHRSTRRREAKIKSDREAREKHDFEEAAKARKTGRIMPLENILETVRKAHKGEFVGVEIEKENGVWIYEIKMVSPDSRFFEVYVDAATGKIVRTWGK